MSKTFKSASSERKVRIWEANLGVAVCVEDPITNETTSTQIAPPDAPALALAILEAAGYTEDDRDDSGLTHFAIAMLNLRMGIENQERVTAEAKEQAELEAEALKLWLACRAVSNKYQTEDIKFSDLDAIEQAEWLAVARKAREIGAEK